MKRQGKRCGKESGTAGEYRLEGGWRKTSACTSNAYERVVSVHCKTHATAWLTSPSFWPPPIDTGDLFWIIFRGQSVARLFSPSLFFSLCRSFGLCGKKWGFARTGARFSAEFRCARASLSNERTQRGRSSPKRAPCRPELFLFPRLSFG